jgi:asparagine N-glycosylation enzyme membrane subunit Stt3
MNKEEELLRERKKNLFNKIKKNRTFVYLGILIIILFLTFSMRISNFTTGDGLKDVTTGEYTLGPDLDPYLFLRWTKDIVANGSVPINDTMRYSPLGYDTRMETVFLSYSLAYFYKFIHAFNSDVSVTFAASLAPAVFFIFACLFFFLFTRRLFIKKNEDVRNIIALIATLFFAFAPALLHRTTGGIPEKESMGFVFINIAFYFLLVAIQSKTKIKSIIFGAISGIAVGLLGLVWGGVSFVFICLGLFLLVRFFTGYTHEEFFSYLSCILAYTFILSFLTGKYGGIMGMLTSITSAILYPLLLLYALEIAFTHFNLDKKLKKSSKVLTGYVVAFVLLVVFIIKRAFILNIFGDIKRSIFSIAANTRFSQTVAENNQLYFTSWVSQFGQTLFWLFMISSVLILLEVIKHFKTRQKIVLSLGYFWFIFSMIYSKYSQESSLNGVSVLSFLMYLSGFLVLISGIVYAYLKERKNPEIFKTLNTEMIFLIVLFVIGAFSARTIVRLVMLLIPAVSILIAYLVCELPLRALHSKDETKKILLWFAAIVVVIIAFYSFYNFAAISSNQAKNTRPGAYEIQWQHAMSWVRENTAKDAVFAHWWDYGYWVQSIGERTTVLDGGNAIVYWNHLMGRHVLTGHSEPEALEFLKVHNANYFLIDSTDIGKYPAYSSIGSDENYDRYSQMSTFVLNEQYSQEMRNSTRVFYSGSAIFDRDFVWFSEAKNQEIVLKQWNNNYFIGGFLAYIDNSGKLTSQPEAVIVYNGKQLDEYIPVRYAYVASENKLYDFGSGMGACLYIIPAVDSTSIKNLGASLFISEKSMEALWVKLYLFDKSQNFKLKLNQSSLLVESIRGMGYNITDIVYYGGQINGPIKIWEIDYPEDTKINPEYLLKDYPNQNLTIVTIKFR